MKLIDSTQLSSEDWLALMPILFQRRGYKLDGCVLWLKGKKSQHLAYCLPTLSTLCVDDLEKWTHAGAQPAAAFSYVVTRGRFCPEARASMVPWESVPVDGSELQQWLRSAGLL